MKKATIIIAIMGLLVSATAYAFIKLKDIKRDEFYSVKEQNQQDREAINENERLANEVDDANDPYHQYNELSLNEYQYIKVNDCMQSYLENKDFEDVNNCQEQIVDAIVAQKGERSFIKSIMGHMLDYYKGGVIIRFNYLENIMTSSDLDNYLVRAFLNKYRNPQELSHIFNNHKAYFFDYISKKVYDKVYKKTIDSFLNSYEEIHRQVDREAFYEDIYNKAETQNKQYYYWDYTFWKRRELEKNDVVLHRILEEINAYYLED